LGNGFWHFERGYGAQLPWVALVGVAAVLAAVAVRRSRPGPLGIHWPAACLAAGAGLGIAVATLTPRGFARTPGHVQLVPMRTIRGYVWDYGTAESVFLYVLGNVALFVPLGLFLHLALRRSVAVTVLLGALASLGVEVLQLPIWSRSSDVDDLILNTAGAAAGAAGAWLVLRLPEAWQRPRLLFPVEPRPRRPVSAPRA
jgi:hypothetical protein